MLRSGAESFSVEQWLQISAFWIRCWVHNRKKVGENLPDLDEVCVRTRWIGFLVKITLKRTSNEVAVRWNVQGTYFQRLENECFSWPVHWCRLWTWSLLPRRRHTHANVIIIRHYAFWETQRGLARSKKSRPSFLGFFKNGYKTSGKFPSLNEGRFLKGLRGC